MGSKYHDFIESADAIAAMQDDSRLITERIAVIAEHGKVVIEASKHLLAEGSKKSKTSHEASESTPSLDVSSFTSGAAMYLCIKCIVKRFLSEKACTLVRFGASSQSAIAIVHLRCAFMMLLLPYGECVMLCRCRFWSPHSY